MGAQRCLFPPQWTARTQNASAVGSGAAAGGQACWESRKPPEN